MIKNKIYNNKEKTMIGYRFDLLKEKIENKNIYFFPLHEQLKLRPLYFFLFKRQMREIVLKEFNSSIYFRTSLFVKTYTVFAETPWSNYEFEI